ncbi:MAG: glycosyl hydrolase [Candidatus Binatia bacterium]|nr:MAG: glycosyl hydrolase [Candidatus Binatia bacterium]
MRVDVIIPALNEAESIGPVVRCIPRPPVRSVIVVDNGSTDGTAERAQQAGALVVREPRRGYGRACLAGIAALPTDTDVVVFLDGDGSDDPACLSRLLDPIIRNQADLVVGSRLLGRTEPGALTRVQKTGNQLAALWLRRRFGIGVTDLGPFRAIRRPALQALRMRDRGYGWTVEMQIKAARRGLRYQEVPVPYRPRRSGKSKVSGTFCGSFGAAFKIIAYLAWYDWMRGIAR